MGLMDEWTNGRISESANRKSRILTLVALAFLTMGLVHLCRAWQSYRNVSLLAEWDPSLLPWALFALSLTWAAGFLAAGWGLWRRRGWGRQLTLWLPPVYGVYSAGTILLFTQSPYARGRWVVAGLGWAVVSLLVSWLLTRGRFKIQFSVR